MRYATAVTLGALAIAAFPADSSAARRHHGGAGAQPGNNIISSSYNVICVAFAYMGVAKADCSRG